MGQTRLQFTPSGASQVTVNLGTHPILRRYQGSLESEGDLDVTRGGVHSSVVHDAFFQHSWLLEHIKGPGNTLTGTESTLFFGLTAWLAHVRGGGVFSFALDAANTSDTTFSTSEAAGTTSIPVASTSGFSADDWVFVEDANNPNLAHLGQVNSVTTTSVVLKDGLAFNFSAASVMRHADYFPKCVVLKSKFQEKEAGKGNKIWDLDVQMRTVRTA